MVFTYNGIKVHYSQYGDKSEKPCLLLHGWGASSEVFAGLMQHFPNKNFITIDFPPFGKSENEPIDWNIFTYVSMVMSLCEHLHIATCDVLGHSFGGRVAILLAALKKQLVANLILVDSAGIHPKRSIKYYYKVYKYKIYRHFGKAISNAGSSDYQKLSPQMKKVFVSIVNQDLEEYCLRIHANTLIVFGKNDKDTPIYMAKSFKKLIRNSKLEILDDAGHYSFLDSPLSFYRLLGQFWEEK